MLPKEIDRIIIPPIKCQGIKTKLIKFIARSIIWNGEGRWIEPFLGSGVVVFNIQPKRAILADTNKHIINFYSSLKDGYFDEKDVAEYLNEKGNKLKQKGADFYYEIRDHFNKNGGSLEFLFLNRACFNGVMRFNSKGGYNVPFGHKPDRFRKAYVTKIRNQVLNAKKIIKDNDWDFTCQPYKTTIEMALPHDFIYLDPPYFGRHTDYYNSWSENDAIYLSNLINRKDIPFALSMWLKNKYRINTHLLKYWDNCEMTQYGHFYHVGSNENLRNEMIEILAIKKGFLNRSHENLINNKLESSQLSLGFEKTLASL